MKKAIIIVAILFALSSIATVVSAVALGASGISQLVDYFNENGGFDFVDDEGISIGGDEFFDRIEDGFEEKFDSGNIFDGRDFSIIGNPDLQIAGDKASSIDISDKDEIIIHADVASVVIKSTDDGFMTATADTYSKTNLASGNEYELLIAENGYDVYLKSDKNIKNSVCELTVEIPESYKGKVTVTVDVGELELRGAKLETLDAKVSVGEIEAKSGSANAAAFSVETGEIDIGKSFFCFTSLSAETNIGSVEYNLPEGRFVEIDYSVKTGAAETEKPEAAGFTVTGSAQAGLEGVSVSGKITGSYGTVTVDTVLNANIQVGIGDIEFDVE